MVIAVIIILLIIIAVSIYNYLSGKKLIRDFIDYIVLRDASLEELDQRWLSGQDRSNITISFTTIPERISKIDLTLKSLLKQSRLPKRIHLYLPFRSFRNDLQYIVPEYLKKLNGLQIVRIDTDFGPATKFIPAIENHPGNDPILVVDDDNIYPKRYIESFEKASEKYPNKILAASGWRVPKDLIDKPTTLWSNLFKRPPTPIPGTRIKRPYEVDIIQGYSGFLIQPKFFSIHDLKDYSQAPREARFVDDVWISIHAKVTKLVFPMKRFCFTPFFTRQFFKNSSLAKINNRGKEDHGQRNNSIVLKAYRKKWNHNL